MKVTLRGIDCCWSMFLISIAQAVPVSWQLADNYTDDYQISSTSTLPSNVCTYGGEVYTEGQTRMSGNLCESCTCHPPDFVCYNRTCDIKPGCKALHFAGQCCPEYVCDCQKNGRTYGNGEKVEEPNPCNVCYCRGGEIKCAGVTCYTRLDCEPHYVPGKCCPKYDHCPALEMKERELPPIFGLEATAVPVRHSTDSDATIITTVPDLLDAPVSAHPQVGTLQIIEVYPDRDITQDVKPHESGPEHNLQVAHDKTTELAHANTTNTEVTHETIDLTSTTREEATKDPTTTTIPTEALELSTSSPKDAIILKSEGLEEVTHVPKTDHFHQLEEVRYTSAEETQNPKRANLNKNENQQQFFSIPASLTTTDVPFLAEEKSIEWEESEENVEGTISSYTTQGNALITENPEDISQSSKNADIVKSYPNVNSKGTQMSFTNKISIPSLKTEEGSKPFSSFNSEEILATSPGVETTLEYQNLDSTTSIYPDTQLYTTIQNDEKRSQDFESDCPETTTEVYIIEESPISSLPSIFGLDVTEDSTEQLPSSTKGLQIFSDASEGTTEVNNFTTEFPSKFILEETENIPLYQESRDNKESNVDDGNSYLKTFALDEMSPGSSSNNNLPSLAPENDSSTIALVEIAWLEPTVTETNLVSSEASLPATINNFPPTNFTASDIINFTPTTSEEISSSSIPAENSSLPSSAAPAESFVTNVPETINSQNLTAFGIIPSWHSEDNFTSLAVDDETYILNLTDPENYESAPTEFGEKFLPSTQGQLVHDESTSPDEVSLLTSSSTLNATIDPEHIYPSSLLVTENNSNSSAQADSTLSSLAYEGYSLTKASVEIVYPTSPTILEQIYEETSPSPEKFHSTAALVPENNTSPPSTKTAFGGSFNTSFPGTEITILPFSPSSDFSVSPGENDYITASTTQSPDISNSDNFFTNHAISMDSTTKSILTVEESSDTYLLTETTTKQETLTELKNATTLSIDNITHITIGYPERNETSTLLHKGNETQEYTLQDVEGSHHYSQPSKTELPTNTPITKKAENPTVTLAEILLKWLQSKNTKSDAPLIENTNGTNCVPVTNGTDQDERNTAVSDPPLNFWSALTAELHKIINETSENDTNASEAKEVETTKDGSSRNGTMRSLEVEKTKINDQSVEISTSDIENLAEALAKDGFEVNPYSEEADVPLHLKYPFTDESLAPVLAMISDQLQFLKLGEEQPLYVELPQEQEPVKVNEQAHMPGELIVPTSEPITVQMVKVDAFRDEGAITQFNQTQTMLT